MMDNKEIKKKDELVEDIAIQNHEVDLEKQEENPGIGYEIVINSEEV